MNEPDVDVFRVRTLIMDRWGEIEILPRVVHTSERRFFYFYDGIFENGFKSEMAERLCSVI